MKFGNALAIGAALGSLAFGAGVARAQADAAAPSAQPEQPAAEASVAAEGAGAAQAPATFTDAEIRQFAGAATAVQKIQADATLAADQKQPKMAEAVQASGLTPQRYNEIAVASRADPALLQRIQAAAAAPAAAPATAARSAPAAAPQQP